MIHLQWETTASPEGNAASLAGDAVSPAGDLLASLAGDAVSPAGDLLASPNFGICDTTLTVGSNLEPKQMLANSLI
jgi:hypothetical protein